MKRKMKWIVCLILLFILVIPSESILSPKYTIKFATLAPEGSTWMKVLEEFNQELLEKTDGEVGFRIYAGGVLGDEKDVLRKIRIGQLHAAGFTGVGLGAIVPKVRILDTPFLFRNYEEVDFIYNKFGDRFAKKFSKNGYELLGWAEVGFVYVFTKKPVRGLDDLRKIKMWVWQGDRVAEATFKAFGLKPVPLSVIDVMTALQTGMVDGVYTSPLAAISLQWFTKVNYMMEVPLADASGAVLISKRMYNRIPDKYHQTLKSLGKKYMDKLTRSSREDNAKSIETLKEKGIKVTPPPDSTTLWNYYQAGDAARRELVGDFYSKELFNEVNTALEKFRNKHGDK